MFSAWSTLPSNTDETYIARYLFETDGYNLQLSDLTNIWSETLTRRQLIEKAQREKCVIDPSDDVGQYRALLEKLEDGIKGRNDTLIDITRNKTGTKFSLEVSTTLPKPLGTLTWEFKPALQPPESFKTEIVMPLIGISYAQERHIDELIRLLKEKDAAISKMLDKFESSGLVIASIFPNTGKTGKTSGQDQRDQIVRHVKGLKPFDESLWRRGISEIDIESIQVEELFNTAFASGNHVKIERLGRMTGGAEGASRSKRGHRNGIMHGQGLSRQDTSTDAFQRQKTPIHIRYKDLVNSPRGTFNDRSHAQEIEAMEVEKESTDDEQLLHTAYQAEKKVEHVSDYHEPLLTTKATEEVPAEAPMVAKSPSPARSPPLMQHAVSPSAKEASSPSRSGPRKLGMIGGSKRTSPAPMQSDGKPLRRRLGQLGGRAAVSEPAPAIDLSSSESATRETSHEPENEHEQENVPGIGLSDRNTTGKESSIASRSIIPDNVQTVTREDTSEEDDEQRADRRREELKRQIAEKGKVQGKRKRRF